MENMVVADDELRLFDSTSIGRRMTGETWAVPSGLVLGFITDGRRGRTRVLFHDAGAISDTLAAPSHA